MKRRDFITLVGGAAAAWPIAARAQQPTIQAVGFLGSDSPDQYVARLRAFRQGLKEAGYIDGQNLTSEYRWAQGRNDQLPALAADLVRGHLAVIVASTTPSVLALKAATKTIPIVFFIAGDPVALGLVASLNRPGGNLTGTTTLTLEVGSKWLQLLHEMVTKATTFALLVNPSSPELAETQSRDLRAAAANLGVQFHVVQASTDSELEFVFANVAERRADALVVSSDSFFFTRCELLAALAARHAIPTIFGFREFPAAGGLMSYGASVTDQHRTVGVYTGLILKGEKPADLPVQQATKVELTINLRTAKALGLDVPPTLLARADEVIE
jgi:putative tryptophan/tyrosine transport system substrate-binding protein